jgi:hypothetical protein
MLGATIGREESLSSYLVIALSIAVNVLLYAIAFSVIWAVLWTLKRWCASLRDGTTI